MNYGDFYRSFDPAPFYEERGWLIGDGRIGGKAKGLSFAHHILEKNGLLEDVHLPKYSFVITTSVFDEFMEQNNLWERLMNLRAHSDQSFTKYARRPACRPRSTGRSKRYWT